MKLMNPTDQNIWLPKAPLISRIIENIDITYGVSQVPEEADKY
jgi:hypothetical protein